MSPVRILLTIVLILGTASCAHERVVVDPKVIEVPVPVACTVKLPPKPQTYVDKVVLTGDKRQDAVAVFRAMEAELEARIAYEIKLYAVALKCTGGANE